MASGSVIEYGASAAPSGGSSTATPTGKQVMETVGAERDGMTERRPRPSSAERLVDVTPEGVPRPAAAHVHGVPRRPGSSRAGRGDAGRSGPMIQYRSILKRLGEFFGPYRSAGSGRATSPSTSRSRPSSYEASTVGRDLTVLHDLFATAMREELIESNPAAGAEQPKKAQRSWRILEPAEVARVRKAFTDEQARTMFLTLVLTGIRRNELRELRWRDVDLLDGVLRVRGTKTRGGEALDRALPRSRHRARGALPADGVQGRRRVRVLPPGARHAATRRSCSPSSSARRSSRPGSPTTCGRSTTCATRR